MVVGWSIGGVVAIDRALVTDDVTVGLLEPAPSSEEAADTQDAACRRRRSYRRPPRTGPGARRCFCAGR